MSLDLTCPHCQQLFRPAGEFAGRLASCPHCSQQVRIPASDFRIPTVDQGLDSSWNSPTTTWFVQAEDGKQYGPVTGEQLHGWYEEGRITADCQLLRKGASQWQWATDLYPDLEQPAERKPESLAEAKPAQPKKPALRAAPTQAATQITALSPSDFPTAGSGLKAIGPVVRPLPPGYGEPRIHSAEAMENRRKFAPFMVANRDQPLLHKMLFVVAIANFIVGSLRALLFFVGLLNQILLVGALREDTDKQVMMRVAISLAITFLMLVLNIAIISGGIGLLQQRDWGRTATYLGTLVSMIVQLTGVCVSMMLGAESMGLARVMWILLLVFLLPSILFDAFAASTLSIPSVVADLEE